MTERIAPWQFREAPGTEDWRVLGEGACAFFPTGSFTAGARLIQAIGDWTASTRTTPTSLADGEGNEACVCTIGARD